LCLTINFFEQCLRKIFKADWREFEISIITARKNVGENKYRTSDEGKWIYWRKRARNGVRCKATKYNVSSERNVLTYAREFADVHVFYIGGEDVSIKFKNLRYATILKHNG